jgi:muramoyltetrapeptide carboxypeptidase
MSGVGVRPGVAEGVVVGGNVAMLASSAGTSSVHGAADSIAVLEDVGEAPYRLDRALTQLLSAGWFAGVRAVACGQFDRCGEPELVRRLLIARLGDLGVPLVLDLPFGHRERNHPLPLGRPATLDGGTGIFTFRSLNSPAD